jgi:hypothetical protein
MGIFGDFWGFFWTFFWTFLKMSIFHFPKIVLEKRCFVTEKIFSVTKNCKHEKNCDDKIFFLKIYFCKKTV